MQSGGAEVWLSSLVGTLFSSRTQIEQWAGRGMRFRSTSTLPAKDGINYNKVRRAATLLWPVKICTETLTLMAGFGQSERASSATVETPPGRYGHLEWGQM